MLVPIPLALALLAHSPSPRRLEPRDTCPPPAGADTVTVSVVATMAPKSPADSLPPGYDRQFITEVSRRLVLPAPLALVPYRKMGKPPELDLRGLVSAKPVRDRHPKSQPVADGALAFRVMLGIRLGDSTDAGVRLLATSLSPEADAAVLAAVQAMIADGLVTALQGRAVDTWLLLRTVDSVGPSDLVIFRVRTPRVALHQVGIRSAPAPRYPVGLRTKRQSGAVQAEFVVGADGRVVPGSLRFVSATHLDFALSVAEALAEYRFLPATVGGCKVPQLLEMPFLYDVR